MSYTKDEYEQAELVAPMGIDYCYTPFVTVKKREDGRFDVEIDWSCSFQYSHDNDESRREIGSGMRDYHWAPYAEDQERALDHWIASQPTTFIITDPKEQS